MSPSLFPTQMCWEPTRLNCATSSQKFTKHTAFWAPLNHRPRTRSLDWNCQRTNSWNFPQQLMIWVDIFPFPRGLFSGSRCWFIWGIYIPTFLLSWCFIYQCLLVRLYHLPRSEWKTPPSVYRYIYICIPRVFNHHLTKMVLPFGWW